MTIAVNTETARFADQLDRSFHGGAWHGPALAEALDGVDAAAAYARPVAGGHNIFELTGHVAFWLDGARRRIHGEALTGLAPEADWPTSDGSEGGWRAVRADLDEAHRRLHATVLALGDEQLDDAVAGCDPTVRGMLLGVLQHNAYHAGQIVLLRKASAEAGGGR